MTTSIDTSFATAATTGSAIGGADHGKARAGAGQFDDIFSDVAQQSAEEAKTAGEDGKAGEKKGKSISARDAAAFGRLLQRWDNGEETAATPAAQGATDEEATTRNAATAQGKAVKGRGEQQSAATLPPSTETPAHDSQDENAPDATGAGTPAPTADQPKVRMTPDARAAKDVREARAQADKADPQADGATGAEETRRADSPDSDQQTTDRTDKGKGPKAAVAAEPQPSATTDAAGAAAPTTALASLAGAALPQLQQAAARGKAQGDDGEQSSSGGQSTDGAADARPASGEGDDQVNHIKVSVTRRETHFAPVLDLNQQHAAATADTKAAARDVATQEFAQAQAETEAKASGSGKAAVGEKSAQAGATTTGAAGASGTGTANGLSGLTSLPFTTAAQVSRAITEEAARMRSGEPAGPQTTTQGPVRILEMTVTPESLGRVTIQMRLTANGLEVRVRASEAATAQMLAQDHDALVRIIERSGTKVDNLDIVKSIASPVEASVRPAWSAPQSSGANAEQDGQQRREQGRNGENSGRGNQNDDAQSRSRHSSDSADD
ncbi:flagellar hook-length control protein FliK [Xanthobacter sp. V0B-10]|uniref:flagellar hook-length control protein FliK n=1 Tax=Xanthobacter albus TaxID=3119929 RepID=UPI003726728D